MKIHAIIRHCNFSSNEVRKKNRPSWFDREKIFNYFLKTIDNRVDVTVMFDGDVSKHFLAKETRCKIVEKQGGNDSRSFLNLLEYTKNQNYSDDDIVYFLEDDYLHRIGWVDILMDGVENMSCDYFTLYDHPDKYFLPAYTELQSAIITTSKSHWRTTPSTTNTYAMQFSTLKNHYDEHTKYCDLNTGGWTRDHEKFLNLWSIGSNLVSSIPGYSTHCEIPYMSPIINWDIEFDKLSKL
jgi:hypothetical protein